MRVQRSRQVWRVGRVEAFDRGRLAGTGPAEPDWDVTVPGITEGRPEIVRENSECMLYFHEECTPVPMRLGCIEAVWPPTYWAWMPTMVNRLVPRPVRPGRAARG
jgi:hypothetical protein